MLIRIRQRLASEDGVSLVELLVSMVVLAIVMMGLASTSIASLASVRNSESRIRATALANEVLENAQAIPFDETGFFTADPDRTAASIVVPGTRPSAAVCATTIPTPFGCRVPVARETVTRDGKTYTVNREIVWDDNPLTGSSEDYRRITVTVTWGDGGTARSQTAEALRASPLQQSEFVLTGFDVDPPIVEIDSAGNVLTSPVELTAAVTRTPDNGFVRVTLTDRSGAVHHHNLTSLNGEDFSRLLPTYAYANGDVLLTFTAVWNGETVQGQKLVRFVQPLAIQAEFSPPSASICAESTEYAPAVQVLIHIEGTVMEDAVTVTWPGGSGTAAHDASRDDVRGAGFTFTIPQGSYTETMTVTVDVVRQSDAATATRDFTFTLDRPVCGS